MDLIYEILDKKVFAVAGVSRNPEKWGTKVYNHLRKKGYKVYPINPGMKEIEGVKCYGSLKEIPDEIDVAVSVIAPSKTLEMAKHCHEIGIRYLWMQPGADSEEVLSYCRKHDIKTISGQCLLIKA